jgi:hypothetical protein
MKRNRNTKSKPATKIGNSPEAMLGCMRLLVAICKHK